MAEPRAAAKAEIELLRSLLRAVLEHGADPEWRVCRCGWCALMRRIDAALPPAEEVTSGA